MHLFCDVFHHVVEALNGLFAVLIGLASLPLEEAIACWVLPSLEYIIVRNATGR